MITYLNEVKRCFNELIYNIIATMPYVVVIYIRL